MSTNTSTTHWKHTAFPLLMVLVGLSSVYGAVKALTLFSKYSGTETLNVVGGLGLFIGATTYTVAGLVARRAAGPVFVDYGARRWKRLRLFLAALIIGFFVSRLISLETYDLPSVCATLILPALAVSLGQIGMVRLQIRKNGILAHAALIEWDKIDVYAWTGESGCTLEIRTTAVLSVLGRREFPVPPALKETIEQRLQEGRSSNS